MPLCNSILKNLERILGTVANPNLFPFSAKLILDPWKNVFDQGELQAFVVRSIVPKLHTAFAELKVKSSGFCLGNTR